MCVNTNFVLRPIRTRTHSYVGIRLSWCQHLMRFGSTISMGFRTKYQFGAECAEQKKTRLCVCTSVCAHAAWCALLQRNVYVISLFRCNPLCSLTDRLFGITAGAGTQDCIKRDVYYAMRSTHARQWIYQHISVAHLAAIIR